jgi:hypothetical protein
MKKLLALGLWTTSVLITAGLITSVGLYSLTRQSLKVVHTWKQPSQVNYQSNDPYYLSVLESDRDWRDYPFTFEPKYRYLIYVGINDKTPSYGHFLEFPFDPVVTGIDGYLNQSTVTWTPAGVTLKTPTQHELFIPKQMFIGGR